MITQFRIFEKVSDKDMTMGRYVVLNFLESDVTDAPKQLINYILNNVGKITNTIISGGQVTVRYDNVNTNLLTLAKEFDKNGIKADEKYLYVLNVDNGEIKYISDNKEELEIKMKTDKYNL